MQCYRIMSNSTPINGITQTLTTHSIKHNAKPHTIILLAPVDGCFLLTLDLLDAYELCHYKKVAKCLPCVINTESQPFY